MSEILLEKFKDGEFVKVKDLSQIFNLNIEDVKKIMERGVELGILFESMDDEFGLKTGGLNDEEKIKEFKEYVESNFVLSPLKPIHLNIKETELKDDVLQDLAMRRKQEASESLVTHIEKNNHIVTLRDDLKNEVWIYQNGIYVPSGESFTKEFCRKILCQTYTTQFMNQVLDKLRADTYKEADEFFMEETKNLNEIPVKNGILNVKNKELSIFNPKKIFFNKINATFDPSKKCPEIEKFLKEVLKSPEDIDVAFEIIGTTLYKKYFPQTAIALYGDGENGKGIFTKLIRHFLGEKNCSSLPLGQLTPDSFSVAELFGKLANISGDVGNDELRNTGRFKELTSGTDLITAKRKFLRDLFFENYAKMIFGLNGLPRVYDFSHGFWRRWIILIFPYLFLKKSEYDLIKDKKNVKLADPEILNKLITPDELSGLLNEALKGLERVLKNKQFSYTKSTQEIKDFWIRKSDSFTAFCMDCIKESAEGYISKKNLRNIFNKYCKKHKIKGTSDKNIKAVLEDLFGVIESRKTLEEGFDNVWEGITFKSSIKDINGFSPYIRNDNSPIGVKTPDSIDSKELFDKIERVKFK